MRAERSRTVYWMLFKKENVCGYWARGVKIYYGSAFTQGQLFVVENRQICSEYLTKLGTLVQGDRM